LVDIQYFPNFLSEKSNHTFIGHVKIFPNKICIKQYI